jgi:hypothetical protein
LQCLHYQFAGFEHYDVVTFDGRGVGCAEETRLRIMSFVTASEVAKSSADNNEDAARRLALGILESDTRAICVRQFVVELPLR